MQDQGTGSQCDGLDLEAVEQAIVAMLMSSDPNGVWWRPDIEQEIGDVADVHDALANLERSGLVHLQGEMVAVTRAAFRASELLI
jgi:hypothetical protein